MAYREASPREVVRVELPAGDAHLFMAVAAHVTLLVAMIAVGLWPLVTDHDSAGPILASVFVASLLVFASFFHAMDLRVRQRSRHRWLRGTVEVAGEGEGRKIVVEGREHDARSASCALSHFSVHVRHRGGRGTEVHFYGVHLVFDDVAYQIFHTKESMEAALLAKSVASQLSLGHVREVEHFPYSVRTDTGVVVFAGLGELGVFFALFMTAMDTNPITWAAAMGAYLVVHLGVHQLIVSARAGEAERAAASLIASAAQAPGPKKKKKAKKKKRARPSEAAPPG